MEGQGDGNLAPLAPFTTPWRLTGLMAASEFRKSTPRPHQLVEPHCSPKRRRHRCLATILAGPPSFKLASCREM